MTADKINTKTIARIAAIQTFYQYQLADQESDINILAQKTLAFYQEQNRENKAESPNKKPMKIKPSISYFNELLKFTIENLQQIDHEISLHLAIDWEMKDLSNLLLAILRIGVCELKFFPETPPKVVINEFAGITSEMLDDHKVGFVNLVLDKISQRISN